MAEEEPVMAARVRSSMVLVAACISVGLMFVACGGGNASKDNEGAAAAAAAQFFGQEATGGGLPEGVGVTSVGTRVISPLSVDSDQKKQSVTLRYCIVYDYHDSVTPFKPHTRVYVTSKTKDGWRSEPVKDAATCEGVN